MILAQLSHFLMDFENFFTNSHQFGYTETIYETLTLFKGKYFYTSISVYCILQ